jgi:hypothetical protein
VLLDSPPVLANVTQCCLSAAENAGHSFLISSRTARSLSTHRRKVSAWPPCPIPGSADWLAIPRQTGRMSRVGIPSDRADSVEGTDVAIAMTNTKEPRMFWLVHTHPGLVSQTKSPAEDRAEAKSV